MPYSFLSHLEFSRTGERLYADVVQGLSPAGAPLLARYDLDGVREAVTPTEARPPGSGAVRPSAPIFVR